MTRNTRRTTGRRGYTLMEMLLVQGVIVALVAMSWPALRGSLDKNRLLAAARQVRTELVQARLKAAETGVPQQFRYQTGDRRFEVTSTSAATGLGAKAGATSGFGGMKAGRNAPVESADMDEEADMRVAMLDEEIRFADASSCAAQDERDLGAPVVRDELASSEGLGTENWSAPVVFLPNGRSSNARVRLLGPRGFHVDVLLRGLTGSVTVSELTRDEESE